MKPKDNESVAKQETIKFSNELTPSFHKTCNIGTYELKEYDDYTKLGKVIPITADNELSFYKLFIKLMAVQLEYEQDLLERTNSNYVVNKNRPTEPLIKGDIDYLAMFLKEPLTFTLSYSDKTDHFGYFSKMIGKTSISAKNAFVRIRNLKYIYKNEDNQIVPCTELQYLRVNIKKQIAEKGFALFSYNFNSVVV